jgi:hypothetical protein
MTLFGYQLFAKPEPINPASELAKRGHELRRQSVKAVARQMCNEMGKPIPEALQ